ncbi:hypothetical protein [Legionella sp. W05-934-2]|uniref:hypothetical protein n=1 Tax=Legionella sp. W05-934-2 TaxID=1198649 RepID=UPI00346381CA
MPINRNTIASQLLQNALRGINSTNQEDINTQPAKLSDFALFTKTNEPLNQISLQSYNLQLMKEWRSFLTNKAIQPTTPHSKSSQFKLALLTFLGTLYFACEGFDGITALLTTLAGIITLPASLLIFFGILFSILSVIIFYSFDLVEISKNLNISWRHTPKLVDLYVEQFDEMKSIIRDMRSELNLGNLESLDKDQCIIWLNQLEEHYQTIRQQSIVLNQQLDRPVMNHIQNAITFLAGLIHFSSGFFAGQTVMMYICAGLSLTAAPTALPILAFSLFIGIAAVSIYWYVEKPGIEKFVSRWIGIDKDKLEKIDKPGRIDHKIDEIKTLKTALGMFRSAANDTRLRETSVDELPQCHHIQGQVGEKAIA